LAPVTPGNPHWFSREPDEAGQLAFVQQRPHPAVAAGVRRRLVAKVEMRG